MLHNDVMNSMKEDPPLVQAIAMHNDNAAKLARALTSSGYEATGQSVRNWLKRGVPAKACKAIEEVTGGSVTREMLLPDIFG